MHMRFDYLTCEDKLNVNVIMEVNTHQMNNYEVFILF